MYFWNKEWMPLLLNRLRKKWGRDQRWQCARNGGSYQDTVKETGRRTLSCWNYYSFPCPGSCRDTRRQKWSTQLMLLCCRPQEDALSYGHGHPRPDLVPPVWTRQRERNRIQLPEHMDESEATNGASWEASPKPQADRFQDPPPTAPSWSHPRMTAMSNTAKERNCPIPLRQWSSSFAILLASLFQLLKISWFICFLNPPGI